MRTSNKIQLMQALAAMSVSPSSSYYLHDDKDLIENTSPLVVRGRVGASKDFKAKRKAKRKNKRKNR